jgi:hypothetical protein
VLKHFFVPSGLWGLHRFRIASGTGAADEADGEKEEQPRKKRKAARVHDARQIKEGSITGELCREGHQKPTERSTEASALEGSPCPSSAAVVGYVVEIWPHVQMYSIRPRISPASLTCVNRSSSRTSSPIDRPCGAYATPG